MKESDAGQPAGPLPLQGQARSFESAPSQADLRPTALESHLAQEILSWQERSPKPFRVMGEPLAV